MLFAVRKRNIKEERRFNNNDGGQKMQNTEI
jgi:hypothetical protein